MIIVNSRTDNLTALTTTANLLTGTDLAQIPEDGVLEVFGVASAVGQNFSLSLNGFRTIGDREILYIGTTIDVSAHQIGATAVVAGQNVLATIRETANNSTTDTILIFRFTGESEMGE